MTASVAGASGSRHQRSPRSELPAAVQRILELGTRVSRGELSTSTAEELAAAPDVARSLNLRAVTAMSQAACEWAASGQSARAVISQRLVVAALRASEDLPDLVPMRRTGYRAWVQVVTHALVECPDGRLFASARQAGEDLIRLDQEVGADDALPGDLFTVGVLHGDPIAVGVACGPGIVQDPKYLRWSMGQRARICLGEEIADGDDEEASWQMPPPVETLQTADHYFEAAGRSLTGEDLARTLKARAGVLALLGTLGVPNASADHVTLARQALAAAPQNDPQLRLALLGHLHAYGADIDEQELAVPLPDPAELERRYGRDLAVEVLLTAVDLRRQFGDPTSALQELERAKALLSGAREHDRGRVLEATLRVRIAHAGMSEPDPQDDLPEHWRRLAQDLVDGGVTDEQYGFGMAAIALAYAARGDELPGLEKLHSLAQALPAVWELLGDEGYWLERQLLHNFTAGATTRGAWGDAISGYAAALRIEARLGFFEQAADTIDAIANCMRHDGLAAPVDALLDLALAAAQCETRGGDHVVTALQDVWSIAIAAAAPGDAEVAIGLWFTLLQLAKGLRFAMSLASGGDLAPADAEDVALLSTIAALEASMAAGDGDGLACGSPQPPDDLLLVAYRRQLRTAAGEDPATRLANLRERFDDRLARRMLQRSRPLLETLLPIDEVQGALDERTAALITHLGVDGAGHRAWRHLLLTRDTHDGQVLTEGEDDILGVLIGDEHDRLERLHPDALLVSSARQGVVEDPLGAFVTLDGEDALNRLHAHLGERVLARLEHLSTQGFDRLIIVGHGPLHFAPLHLAGPPGKPLADRWTLNYLPNLQLMRPPAPVARRPMSVASLGLSYADQPWGLTAMPDSVPEAETVASLFGTEPMIDPAANRAAFVEALRTARFVHLSAHGRLDASAPAFQHLFLAPDEHSDGRYFAHDLAGLDLRGLELLTLSACETALGRFDTADNPRGLLAGFLLAGARRVVATMWPVAPAVSRWFFSALYAELVEDVDLYEAYRTAQRKTRAKYPEYRHWGAFNMVAGALDILGEDSR